ncbi:MAG: dienelactone hydrolase family protein [Candidatus Omnitrophota bacterium]|nr:dienelactone hydrolase family protein [Candidatus Omnitrophota bacterium]MDZ4242037.1 dienelactone hydrolase family protein [Candidatus Omnitrophota bacterium]
MRYGLAVFLLALFPLTAQAAIKEETVEYKQDETVLEGFLAYDDAVEGKRPAVVIVHDWMGPGDFSEAKARDLAQMGYLALAADIYGQGVRPKDAEEAGKQAGMYKSDRALLRERAKAAYELLKGHPLAEEGKLAAMGYCFGGTTVLEMARAGLDLAGVVSFHGGLQTPSPAEPGTVTAGILVLHGADDPHVPAEEVAAFQGEMTAAGADWQLMSYSGAVHAFTNPAAGNDNSKGAAYNEKADRRSWEAMQLFFNEIFE